MMTDPRYTSESIAKWLFENNIPLRFWLNSQVKQAIHWVIENEDRQAQSFIERGSEIRDHLRAMGALHLLH